MAPADSPPAEPPAADLLPPPWRRPITLRRVLRALAVLFLTFAGLAVMAVMGLNSGPGRDFIRNQIQQMQFDNGMQIRIGAIDGSIYGALTLRDVRLFDPKGLFASAPAIAIDWRPLAFLENRLDIRSATARDIRLRRLPEFLPTDEDKPILPDFDIDIARLTVDRIRIDPAITGRRHLASLSGRAHIRDGRAQIRAAARALTTGNSGGGDVLHVLLDAVPDRNRLAIDARLDAPSGGLVAGLAGWKRPLALSVKGKGDWASWQGAVRGQYGTAELADLALGARNGVFTLKGQVAPAPLLGEGVAARLLAEGARVDLSAALARPRVTLTGHVGSPRFSLNVAGAADLDENRFEGLKLGLALPRPSLVAPKWSGRGVRGGLVLTGPFRMPAASYSLTADSLSFDDIHITSFRVQGAARVEPDRIFIPVAATAARITGIDAAKGGLLDHVRMNGDLAIKDNRILSDNMRIRSDRLNGTAILLADLEKGIYQGAIDGRIDGYRIESVGIFNIDTDLDLNSEKDGGFALSGRVSARSTRLLDAGLRDFLGGNLALAGDVRYGTDGIFRFARVRAHAPDFRLSSGEGRYSPDGGIALSARGWTRRFGDVGLRASGTLGAPVAHVTLARPDMGIGLAGVEADIRGGPHGYAVKGRGMTDYGPLSADVLIVRGKGPLTIDIAHADLDGVGVRGRIRQSAAGPFTGQLAMQGNGTSGTMVLGADGKVQTADIRAEATGSRFSGPANLAIGRAIIDARIALYEQPQINADIQFAATRLDDLYINVARAKIDYRAGHGSAQILAEGKHGLPFRIAAHAAMKPDLWRVALKGRANSIAFATRKPLAIIPEKRRYRLLPGTIDLGGGSVALSGHYGGGLHLDAVADKIDLALFNAAYPDLGIHGSADGTIRLDQAEGGFPDGAARLKIAGFRRSALAMVSQPVDIDLALRLKPDGAEAKALIRRRGAAIGKMQAFLRSLPRTGGSWTARLLAAPLSGGVRYHGPAETLFSFTGLSQQSMRGTIGVAADFSGRLGEPQMTGIVRGTKLTYENATFGTRLTDMQVAGRFTNDRLEFETLSARAGDGQISATGYTSFSADRGFPTDIRATLDNARLARSENVAARATGTLRLTKEAGSQPLISGTLRLPETRYRLIRQGAAQISELDGVRRKPARGYARESGEAARAARIHWRLDIDLVANDELYVMGMGLESEWAADLKLGGTIAAPRLSGALDLKRGTYDFAGRAFTLSRGRLGFTGSAEVNPTIDLAATAEVDNITTILTVTGRAYTPQISFTSSPALPQEEIMARILFGSSVTQLSALQAVQLASSLNSLRSSRGLNPMGALQSATGIDRMRIVGPDEASGRGSSLALGKYITNDIYIEVLTDARGFTATQLEISLTPSLSILSRASSANDNSLNLRYRKDY